MKILGLILFSALFSTAFAAPAAKTKKVTAPEKYAALEDTAAITAPIASTTAIEPTPAPAPRIAQKTQKELPKTAKAAVVTPQPKKAPALPEKTVAAAKPKKSVESKPKTAMVVNAPAIPAMVEPAVVSPAIPASETLSGDLAENSDPKESYDAVPSDQIPLVVKRLRLIELLVSRHARAYDYRALTIGELEARLAQLESRNSRKNQVTTGATAIDEMSRIRETEPLPLPPAHISAGEAEDLEDDVDSATSLE